MYRNMSNLERAARLAAGVAIVGGGLALASPWSLAGIPLIATALVGYCPGYCAWRHLTGRGRACGCEAESCTITHPCAPQRNFQAATSPHAKAPDSDGGADGRPSHEGQNAADAGGNSRYGPGKR